MHLLGYNPQLAAGDLNPWAIGEYITSDITNSQPGVSASNEHNSAVVALLLVGSEEPRSTLL